MIKIIAILDNAIGVGGGFDQSINAIIQMQKLSSNRFIFEIFTTKKRNVHFLNRLDIKVTEVELSIIDKLFVRFSQYNFWYDLQRYLKLISPLEKKLIKHGCDLVYFVTPSNLAIGLQKLNYIYTLWDLCHIEMLEFPEVRNFNTFFTREKNYQYSLQSALLILTESKKLIDVAKHHYGIDSTRFLSMPFSPTPFISKSYARKKNEILKIYNLSKGYFFYPAQFCAHKNHIRILQALIILRDLHNWTPNFVFSGKDYGNMDHIKKFIKDNNLGLQVKLLGFVPSEHMRGLYENDSAVVMPTYFGPSNLPPIEAWSLGLPLIYSNHLSEQSGKAALLFNPDDPKGLSNAMLLSTKPKVRDRLIKQGTQRFLEIEGQRKIAEDKLYIIIKNFSRKRECWK